MAIRVEYEVEIHKKHETKEKRYMLEWCMNTSKVKENPLAIYSRKKFKTDSDPLEISRF